MRIDPALALTRASSRLPELPGPLVLRWIAAVAPLSAPAACTGPPRVTGPAALRLMLPLLVRSALFRAPVVVMARLAEPLVLVMP